MVAFTYNCQGCWHNKDDKFKKDNKDNEDNKDKYNNKDIKNDKISTIKYQAVGNIRSRNHVDIYGT